MMRQGISWYVAVVAVACLCVPALAVVKINEIRIDEPGLDVNEYFDGNVKSIGFQTETLRATVGFEVAANQKFQLQVAVDTAYLCTYA